MATCFVDEALIDSPAALWMLDEPSGTTAIPSAAPGGPTLTLVGDTDFRGVGPFACDPVPPCTNFAKYWNSPLISQRMIWAGTHSSPIAGAAAYSWEAFFFMPVGGGLSGATVGDPFMAGLMSFSAHTGTLQMGWTIVASGGSTTNVGTFPVARGVWHHTVAVINSGAADFWLDGVIVASILSTAGSASSLPRTDARLMDHEVGTEAPSGPNWAIAGMAMYNHVLTPARIAAHAAHACFNVPLGGWQIGAIAIG